MANSLTKVIPQLLAQGLMALRQQAIMPRLVNRAYEEMAGDKGSTIDVPIPSAIQVQDVAPANTPPTTADVAPTSVPIQLNKWKEAAFYLTDKEVMEVMRGTIPMQASEAIKAIANQLDADIFAEAKGVYGFVGTPGTTPFGSDLTEYVQARAALANQLAPMEDRRVVLNPDAEANALLLRAFQDASFGGGTGVIIKGQIGTKLGADWYMDQNVPTHTAGAASGYLVNNVAGHAIGDSVILVDTGTGKFAIGDIVTFAGHSQTYVVTDHSDTDPETSITISPPLVAAVANNVAITKKASHVTNLLFHRDAFAFATRPLQSAVEGLGNLIQSAVDPVSGLTLRLEVSREHKRTRYSFDVLYGVKLVRAALACRIAG